MTRRLLDISTTYPRGVTECNVQNVTNQNAQCSSMEEYEEMVNEALLECHFCPNCYAGCLQSYPAHIQAAGHGCNDKIFAFVPWRKRVLPECPRLCSRLCLYYFCVHSGGMWFGISIIPQTAPRAEMKSVLTKKVTVGVFARVAYSTFDIRHPQNRQMTGRK